MSDEEHLSDEAIDRAIRLLAGPDTWKGTIEEQREAVRQALEGRPADTSIAQIKADLQRAIGEIREAHAERAIAPGLECECEWCSPPEPTTVEEDPDAD